ncbi:MAG: flagellar basal body-associated FliL family protein [Firmicutes bacterium]|nr:flagellar basal body-associated FliL family protein [Bacillota bacterium]
MARIAADARNFIILIALVILLAAGTTYSVFVFLGLPMGGDLEQGPSGPARESSLGPMFDAGTFTVNLSAGGVPAARYVRTGIVLDLDSQATLELVQERDPQVRDRIIAVLRQQTPESISGSEGLEQLKQTLKDAIDQVLPEGSVDDVFFVELVVQ